MWSCRRCTLDWEFERASSFQKKVCAETMRLIQGLLTVIFDADRYGEATDRGRPSRYVVVSPGGSATRTHHQRAAA